MVVVVIVVVSSSSSNNSSSSSSKIEVTKIKIKRSIFLRGGRGWTDRLYVRAERSGARGGGGGEALCS